MADVDAQLVSVKEHAVNYPLEPGFRPRFGTAGFRGPAEKLSGVAFRAGVVAALRCYATQSDCGLVITASHNPVSDNGFKFVDYNGEVFPTKWEEYAERIVAAETPDAVEKACREIVQTEEIQLFQRDGEVWKVFVGYDTRPSSSALLEAASKGIKALRVEIAFESGLQTTPQVHYRVWRRYHKEACGEFQWLKYLSGGFMRMARGTYGRHGKLTVDCANGVTAEKLRRLGGCPGAIPQGYHFQLVNTGDGTLNAKCGAEYVQKENALPMGFDGIEDWQRCASVDGDGDRVVYFTRADQQTYVLDGDRIAALAALHIQTLLNANSAYQEAYSKGVVLTAYSNSAVVEYLKQLGIEVVIATTGVKNLYAAAKTFDLGIYYEANGHGSIVFSDRLAAKLREVDAAGTEDPSNFELLAVLDTMNQTVGDAVSNILLVEAVLRVREWSLEDWMKLYTPLVSKTVGIEVKHRSKLKTDETETRAVAPSGLQDKINDVLNRFDKSRAFVRPSGTEEVVRLYVECRDSASVEQLTSQLRDVVEKALK